MSNKITAALSEMDSTLEFITSVKPAAWYSKALIEDQLYKFACLLWSEPNHTTIIQSKLTQLDGLLA